jgi:hypothetical protein
VLYGAGVRSSQPWKRRRLLAAALVLAAFPAGCKRQNKALTEAEKAPLVVVVEGGQQRLRHPAFGFSILHPGPGFKESPELLQQAGLKRDPDTQTYGFLEADTHSALIIAVMKGMGGTQAKLSEHLEGVLRGLEGSLSGNAETKVLKKEVVWDARRHVANLSVAVGSGLRIDVAAYSVERPGELPLIVNVMVTAPPSDRFAGLLASFRS